MPEGNLRFGEYIRKMRLADSRELTMQDVGNHLGISVQYMSDIEKGRKKPFDRKRLAQLAKFLRLSEGETAKMYDLASRETLNIPYDIEDTFINEEVGDLARYALRQSKAGFIVEEDWKTMIRKSEERRAGKEVVDDD